MMSKLNSLFFALTLLSTTISADNVRALYNSLDPASVSQHLALHDLYPDTPEGQAAMKKAWALLSQSDSRAFNTQIPISASAIHGIIAIVNKQPGQEIPHLSQDQLQVINKLADTLPNRKLKGHYAKTEQEVLSLQTDEIDLSRALFLSQGLQTDLQDYEAMLDLMALQILARLPKNPSPYDKIREMNRFIFEELGFRFPPHSLYVKDIDLYTFLPSVLDSRRGVCLGVSVLYLCLAQRLNLKLEMITPPGHIYVRYHDGDEIINIETTARGINLKSEVYLGIDTRSLQERSMKDVIGLTYFNQASVYWQKNDYVKGLECFLTAKKYLPDDMLLKELMGYNYLMLGDKDKGIQLLNEVKDYIPEYAVSKHTIVDDYLSGSVGIEGIQAIFQHVDEKRESILEKKEKLEKILVQYPRFREGWLNLAITWIQLHRQREALEILEKYHKLDPKNPTAEYYLAMLYASRMDYNLAWEHFNSTEEIVKARDHAPKALKHLKKELESLAPN
jgi:tetratricopeptide (TPR) repeat protein